MLKKISIAAILVLVVSSTISNGQETTREDTLEYIESIFKTCERIESVSRNDSLFVIELNSTPGINFLYKFNIDEIYARETGPAYCKKNGCIEQFSIYGKNKWTHFDYPNRLPFICHGVEEKKFYRAIRYNFNEFSKFSPGIDFPETDQRINSKRKPD